MSLAVPTPRTSGRRQQHPPPREPFLETFILGVPPTSGHVRGAQASLWKSLESVAARVLLCRCRVLLSLGDGSVPVCSADPGSPDSGLWPGEPPLWPDVPVFCPYSSDPESRSWAASPAQSPTALNTAPSVPMSSGPPVHAEGGVLPMPHHHPAHLPASTHDTPHLGVPQNHASPWEEKQAVPLGPLQTISKFCKCPYVLCWTSNPESGQGSGLSMATAPLGLLSSVQCPAAFCWQLLALP